MRIPEWDQLQEVFRKALEMSTSGCTDHLFSSKSSPPFRFESVSCAWCANEVTSLHSATGCKSIYDVGDILRRPRRIHGRASLWQLPWRGYDTRDWPVRSMSPSELCYSRSLVADLSIEVDTCVIEVLNHPIAYNRDWRWTNKIQAAERLQYFQLLCSHPRSQLVSR